MNPLDVDADTAAGLRRKSKVIGAGQWCVALIVMAGSAWSAELAYQHLGEHVGVGALTGFGVDLALASGLILDGWMRSAGQPTRWGTALRWLTAFMTLCLNAGVSALTGHYVLAFMHTFLPVVLVVLTEAGQESQLKLHTLARERVAAEKAARDAQIAADRARYVAEQSQLKKDERDRANGVLVTAQDVLNKARELRQETQREHAEVAAQRTAIEAETAATNTATEQLRRAQQKRDKASDGKAAPSRGKAAVASREERREWVRQERTEGRDPTGADVDRKFGGPRTGTAIVREVEAEQKPTLHLAAGSR